MRLGRRSLGFLAVGCLLAVLAAAALWPGERPHGFLDRVYRDAAGGSHRYVVFVPHAYDPAGSDSYPLIVYLHGAGEKGTDGRRQLHGGLAAAIRQCEPTFDCLTLFPQAAEDWRPKVDDPWRTLALLVEVERAYRVDRRRVYLTGYSMGGFGVWSLAAQHPQRWAAIVPVSGGGDPKLAERMTPIPCWCFHGAADEVVPPVWSRQMVEAVIAAGGQPRYTEYPDCGHGIRDQVFSDEELYRWLREQRLASR